MICKQKHNYYVIEKLCQLNYVPSEHPGETKVGMEMQVVALCTWCGDKITK